MREVVIPKESEMARLDINGRAHEVQVYAATGKPVRSLPLKNLKLV